MKQAILMANAPILQEIQSIRDSQSQPIALISQINQTYQSILSRTQAVEHAVLNKVDKSEVHYLESLVINLQSYDIFQQTTEKMLVSLREDVARQYAEVRPALDEVGSHVVRCSIRFTRVNCRRWRAECSAPTRPSPGLPRR